ncbi:GTP 3',8-cyclase MoaA [Parasphaerochaeta coccoides]|uniref:Radical SAM domain protein n=1 Tax=Parasphaerochaeta coccoides (strain ATCC BAA-1237 / DSM 17374 / SPN1) TaxID=760011 RepID=F4GID2_PARC1|nr:GTP 3',8-cyclase MoaA [Parasphaerochaeta coccoides]AEC01640.1 Radical SAM domain protein [Parasphaerochaeta coccoides DSM 17374]
MKQIYNQWHLRIFSTPKCNLRCIYCNPEGKFEDRKIMDEQVLNNVIKACSELSFKGVHFTGGEPMMRENIILAIKYCKNLNYHDISMTTNGTELFNRNIEELAHAGLKRVNISLDTMYRNEYKKLCGFDSLLTVKDSIIKACSFFSFVKINSVLLRNNLDSISSLIDFILSIKSKNISLKLITLMPCNPIMITESGHDLFHSEVIAEEELLTYLRNKYDVVKTCRVVPGDNPNTVHMTLDGLSVEYLSMPSWNYKCADAGCKKFRLSPYGELSICLNDNPYNINGLSVEEIRDIIRMKVDSKEETLPKDRIHYAKTIGAVRFGNVYGRTDINTFQ